jgi:drug/metabolite transporter (DMT)-like permease
MDSRKPINGQAAGLMIVLSMIWGLQQVVLKAAAPDIAPILQVALRSGIAAILVWVLLIRRERMSFRDRTWLPGMLVGVLFSLEYLSVGEGLRHTSASHSVVFLYTAPIFAAIGLHWKLPEERLHLLQWMGIVLAFVGIFIAFFSRSMQLADPSSTEIIFGDFLALLAGFFWGMTTVIIRCSALARSSASQTLLYQLVGAFILLSLASVCLGQSGINPTPLVWGSLLFQSIVVSFASFLVWFWLLRNYLASQLGVFSFMTPFFGVMFGVWFLNEPLEMSFLVGALFVLFGIGLMSGYGWIIQIATRCHPTAGISG